MTQRMIARYNETANACRKPEDRWDLEYSSPAYIDSLRAHFDAICDEETGALKRALNAEEKRAIQNERQLAAFDFHYWRLNFAKIIDWEKNIVPFRLNIAQHIVTDIWAEHEERGIAIMLQQLKARQLGITTVNQMAVTHRFQFWSNTNAIVASADPKKTVEMGQMIKLCLDEQPWWMLPASPTPGVDKVEKGMIVEYGEINTRLSIAAGNQFHGVARGATPNVGQLSEVSSWANARQDIDASFIRAIHETPDVFVSLESTALGRDNWWYDSWELVKKNWPRGRSRLRGLFLPWFVGTDIYPTPTDLRARPVPTDWIPTDRTIAHAERARHYVLSNPALFKYLAKSDPDWKMPKEQMWFYELERENAIEKKDLNGFLSEMPADDQEAFQNTGLSVIDQDVIMVYRDNVQQPKGVYAIIGDGIHQSLIPPRHLWLTGPGAPPVININVASVMRSTERYQFVPLRFEGYSGYDPNFKLFIYEWPEDGETYGHGVDTSDGIGQDWSVLEGLRLGSPFRPHAQVYEYASPYIKADQLWPLAMAVGTFYSVFNTKAQRRTQSRVCVECRGNGEIVQNEMKKRGWSAFHPWKKYDNKKRTPDGHVHKEGVFTNVWFRSMMMDKFLTVIDEGAIDIGSPWFVNELSSLERDPDEASARAAYNTHDDRVIALCFPLFSLTVDTKPLKTFRRSTPQYLPEAMDLEPQGQFATWKPGLQASHIGHRALQRVERGVLGQHVLGRYRNENMPKGYR